jgi:ACR3 family arsenite efflux pump ArsB
MELVYRTSLATLNKRFWAQWKNCKHCLKFFGKNRILAYPTQFSTLYRMVVFVSLYDVVEKRFVRNVKKLGLVIFLNWAISPYRFHV